MMGDQSFVSPEMRARVRAAAVPVARAAGRIGLTPNALTVIGFVISCAAAYAAWQQSWFAAAVLVIFGGSFDLLDGALARAQNRVTVFGAFLDSTLDRWGEGIVYVGVVAGAAAAEQTVIAALAAATAVSSFQVSYTRAKAESLRLKGEVGIAPRAERLVVLTIGLVGAAIAGGIASGSGGGTSNGALWLGAALLIIFVFASITSIQRMWHVRQQLRTEDSHGK